MPILLRIVIFIAGFLMVVLTLSSALSTFVLPRAARGQLNRIVFGLLRKLFNFILHFAKTYPRRDAIMAYYAPVGSAFSRREQVVNRLEVRAGNPPEEETA